PGRNQRLGVDVHLGGAGGSIDNEVVVVFGTTNQLGSGSGSVIDLGSVIGSEHTGSVGATRTVCAHAVSIRGSASRAIIGRGLGI
ncbi:hypothetical protein, partial [Klebsiella pneumoniae]|uniref:hypothetical protein n=1 Tax=Klebsiella pneumoniae TaxID=573 RepID=UPI003012D3FE